MTHTSILNYKAFVLEQWLNPSSPSVSFKLIECLALIWFLSFLSLSFSMSSPLKAASTCVGV